MSGNLKLETGNSGFLTTVINKASVTEFCVDAISELERAARLHPEWPVELHYHDAEHEEDNLKIARAINDHGRATGSSIFSEEFVEFLLASRKPGNRIAARIELVQAMAMLLRIGCHLDDYVSHRGTESTEKTIKADPSNQSRAASVEHRAVGYHIKNSFLGPVLRGVLVTDDEGRKVMVQP